MSNADQIRKFVVNRYVSPAKAEGRVIITVRTGDVHKAMSLSNAMSNVCSAIGSTKFEQLAGVTQTKRAGPRMGANVYYQFNLNSAPTATFQPLSFRKHSSQTLRTSAKTKLNLNGAVVLVSCVKSKGRHPAPARLLYTSPWFQKVRAIVEATNARWFILSARYGLVSPDKKIAPYEHTLKNMGVAERKTWATHVLNDLIPQIDGEKRVVVFAGDRYREFLMEPLQRKGIKVEVPMEKLALGEQLAWLSQH
jgi:Family of unknown function (DUF6884)